MQGEEITVLKNFVRYAAAFEEAYTSRDFTILEPFFTEGAVYEIHAPSLASQRHDGRDAVLGYLEWVTDHFDLRFDSRQLFRVAGPEEKSDHIELHGIAVYTLGSGERVHLSLTEQAFFEGKRISKLIDYLSPGAALEMQQVVEGHPERFPAELLG